MIFEKVYYDTAENKKRCFWDILVLKTRFYFYLKFFLIILKANKFVKQGKFDNAEYCRTSDKTFKLLENCGAKIHIKGLENLKKVEGPVVFIGNHMSILETFILPGLIIPFKPVSFVVKESLIKHFFFGGVMKATNPISVTRTDPKKDFKSVMSGGRILLKKGRSIIVFPQSTRGDFIVGEFGSIGDKLAQKAGVSVIPIALKTDFWSNGRISKDFGRIYRKRDVYLEFGNPINTDIEKKERHSIIVNFIEAKLNEWSEQ
ncbi:MAG TPA: lysophospholipid acyltransferase family protein [Victivallales bacterium]|nr:lysophospholipid acyltransferase family protein [Victivallales bacterium]